MSKQAFLSAYHDVDGQILHSTRRVELDSFNPKEMLDLYKLDSVKLVELTYREYDKPL